MSKRPTKRSLIWRSDSYKYTHDPMYDDVCENIRSYVEARIGAEHPTLLFNGLQPMLIEYLEGAVVTAQDVEECASFCAIHFGDDTVFNRAGWDRIVKVHGGKLPVTIKAVPEGTKVPVGNVMMTVTLTKDDNHDRWIVNWLECLLLRVWYPITVATLSYHIKQRLIEFKKESSDDVFVDFMLHDFGARGVTSSESAEIGGCAHIINFLGTDTVEGATRAMDYYNADPASLCFSVNAGEHSIMTQRGEAGEKELYRDLLLRFNTGVLAQPIDSYDASRFMNEYVPELKEVILARKPNKNGLVKTVFRPDSLRYEGDTPEDQMVALSISIDNTFGHTVNSKGYKVINPLVALLWGDGIEAAGIFKICRAVIDAGYSVDHLIFGMGGGLLQKVNRDTERFAFKCCSQTRSGVEVDIQKKPLDASKKSKAGNLKLVRMTNDQGVFGYQTINQHHPLFYDLPDELQLVFLDGEVIKEYGFEEVRDRASNG